MTDSKPEHISDVSCPKCRAPHTALYLVETVQHRYDVCVGRRGTLRADFVDTSYPDIAGLQRTLYCATCGHEWPLPQWIDVDYD